MRVHAFRVIHELAYPILRTELPILRQNIVKELSAKVTGSGTAQETSKVISSPGQAARLEDRARLYTRRQEHASQVERRLCLPDVPPGRRRK